MLVNLLSTLQNKTESKEIGNIIMEKKFNFRVLTEAEYYAEKDENENRSQNDENENKNNMEIKKYKKILSPNPKLKIDETYGEKEKLNNTGKIFSRLLEMKKNSPEQKIPEKVQSPYGIDQNCSWRKPHDSKEHSNQNNTINKEDSFVKFGTEYSLNGNHEECSIQYNNVDTYKQLNKEHSSFMNMKDYSLTNSDAYLNVPVGRRSLSRERGASTETQHKSTLLQERLK